MVLKVAAYARVSTDKDDQINSLTNQREYLNQRIIGSLLRYTLTRVSQALKPRNEKVLTV